MQAVSSAATVLLLAVTAVFAKQLQDQNDVYKEQLESAGLVIAGMNPDRNLVEIVENPEHPWFVGVQFHPEFQSKPRKAHPLFADFIAAALSRQNK